MMTGILVVKATVVLAIAAVAASERVTRSAATRHAIVAAAFVVVGLLPLASPLMPPLVLPPQLGAGSMPELVSFAGPDSTPGASRDVAAPAPNHGDAADVGTWTAVWPAAWWCGVVMSLWPMLAGSFAIRRLRWQSRQAPHLTAVARQIAGTSRAHREIEVRTSTRAPAPLTFGVRRPVIVFPEEVRDWSAEDTHRAIVHEVEHILRFDWVTHCAARVVLALYWFHPLAWIAWRRLSAEAERACDDAVVRTGGGLEYAHQLVELAQRLSRRPRLSLGMSAHGDLRGRVAGLLTEQARGKLNRRTAWTIASIAAVVAVGIASARPGASTPASAAASIQGSQSASARGQFEFDVASVRPNDSGDSVMINQWDLRSGRLTLTNQTLVQVIAKAYGARLSSALRRERISGGPHWVGRERFSIVASMPAGIARAEAESSMQMMLRRLLEERFRLKVRIDTRQMPGYSLVALRPGTLGPSVRASQIDCDVAQCGAGGGLAK